MAVTIVNTLFLCIQSFSLSRNRVSSLSIAMSKRGISESSAISQGGSKRLRKISNLESANCVRKSVDHSCMRDSSINRLTAGTQHLQMLDSGL